MEFGVGLDSSSEASPRMTENEGTWAGVSHVKGMIKLLIILDLVVTSWAILSFRHAGVLS